MLQLHSMDVARFNKALSELTKDGDQFILRHITGIIRDFQVPRRSTACTSP